MKVHASIITNPERMSDDEDEVNAFLKENCRSPFMLWPFTRDLMNTNAFVNQIPAVIVVRAEVGIVGLVPLILRRRYGGVRYAEFLPKYWASPDFVLKNNCELIALETILHLVLKRLNSKYIVLDLNCDSPNLQPLRRVCKLNNIPYFERSYQFMDHGMITVDCSWEDYVKSCGLHFRKELRHIKNRLDKEGGWKLTTVENYNQASEEAVYDKILAIEKLSWKEAYRQSTGDSDYNVDWSMMSSSLTEGSNTILGRKIWFLELHDQPVACSLVLQHKGIAYIVKTSFVEKYRKLSVGKFVMYATIKDLFDRKEVQKIDFLTYLPMVRFWRANCMKRVRVRLGNRTFVSLAYTRSVLEKATTRPRHDMERVYHSPTARSQLARVKRRRNIS